MNIQNPIGLSIHFLENGSIQHIEVDPIRISLKAATPFSKTGANLYLRKRSKPVEFKALLGPESNSIFGIQENAFFARGSWDGLDYTCMLQLSEKSLSWQWSIQIINTSSNAVELDLIYLQDIGLKPITSGLINEYYVSQYLERLVLEDQKYGSVICCRQNMKESVGNPWLMLACENTAISGSVDGMQFYGKTYRETGIPEGLLLETMEGNYAGESSVLALQETPFTLSAGDQHTSIFAGTYLPDHPKATSVIDLDQVPSLFLEFTDNLSFPVQSKMLAPVKNIFNISSFLPADDLGDEELDQFFGNERRHSEVENGRLLSFFCGPNDHVMLREKEIRVDRPHGHIMQASAGYAPDENIVSTTSFAFGVFNSHISQGNTNFNVLLSVCTDQFNLTRESGQRIFVELEGRQYLLGVPSAFEIGLNHCRWIYKHGAHIFQVRTWTSKSAPRINMDFRVLRGSNVSLLLTHDFDQLNGWKITPGNNTGEFFARPKLGSMILGKFPGAQFGIRINSVHPDYQACGEELLFPGNTDQVSGSLFILKVPETSEFSMSFIGEVCSQNSRDSIKDTDKQFATDCQDAQTHWQDLSLNLSLPGDQEDVSAIREILPWYGMNALTHFLTPYGLEQFSGAAWGTRDVSQGPVDLLLTMEKYEEAKQVLLTIFSNQNPDGGWPQWWMFDSYSSIRAGDSHGDVFYWVIIALSDYIRVTGDLAILDEVLPFYHVNSGLDSGNKPVSEHVDRLINMIINSFIPGTSLVPFGGGDWNDSLQPVSEELAKKLISSWTVEMNYQAFTQYQKVYELTDISKAKKLKEICEKIRADFNKHLVKDEIVAGYGLLEKDDSISVLLHPTDSKTGIKYSILPMNRGIISEIFTKEQALFHQDIIEKYLKGPDGARLMDRPLKYKGGIQEIFQRAESSTFFGREIGLMYVHEHIRYAESQAWIGNADAFIKALRQAIPVAYRDIVSCGDIRQANCYYSSSDVTFKSRYEADERYDEIKNGNLTLKGGWRVYSSGPGIYVSMIVSRLLGLRVESGNIIIDPVIPYSMDGLSASINLLGRQVTFNYAVSKGTFNPKTILVNGEQLMFTNEENIYRPG
ncbi:MAG: amylo-alpha-1,6-glucosidase, partial [Bacteroidota bacterium]